MTGCGIRETASARLVDGLPEWDLTPEATHISEELRLDPVAMVFITEKYHVGEWCEERNGYHARLHGGDAS